MAPKRGERRVVRPIVQLNVSDKLCRSPARCLYYGMRMHDWEQVDAFRAGMKLARSRRTVRRHDAELRKYLGPREDENLSCFGVEALTDPENPVA